MGLYLNIGNQNFAEFSRTQYFVDKSQLINKLLKRISPKNSSVTAGRGGLENL